MSYQQTLSLVTHVAALFFSMSMSDLEADALSDGMIIRLRLKSQPVAHRQYTVSEFAFETNATFAYPPADALLLANFSQLSLGTASLRSMPGFWDGNQTWKLRFSPTIAGRWSFVAVLADSAGTMTPIQWRSQPFEVVPALTNGPAIYTHGGQLRVSNNSRYLTYWDGTPFFWLGDTWWFAPGDKVPYNTSSNLTVTHSAFRYMVDKRSSQNYSIIQIAFQGTMDNLTLMEQVLGKIKPAYWQKVDEYIAYANAKGLLPFIALCFNDGIDRPSLDQWQVMWRYVIGRYQANAVSWLIGGEYDSPPATTERIEKAWHVGQFIKNTDPYHRAMTIHSHPVGLKQPPLWDQPWYDFIAFQGSHEVPSSPLAPTRPMYFNAYYRDPKLHKTKPINEIEARYEHIRKWKTSDTRAIAYLAIQSGTFGYTYGAHGLWYPTQSWNDSTFWSGWGQSPPWWVALDYPGGQQMGYLRAIYESVEWWKLVPLPDNATTNTQLVIKADVPNVYLVWYPIGFNNKTVMELNNMQSGLKYSVTLMNPQTGQVEEATQPLAVLNSHLVLPTPHTDEDWMVVLRLLS